MINRNEKITPFQLFSITLFSMMFGLHIYPSIIGHKITHEWFIAQIISVILMSAVLLMIIYIFDSQKYSSFDDTLISILGKTPAKILAAFLSVYFILHSVSIICLESNNIQIFLFDKTPVTVIAVVFVAAAFAISVSGHSALARLIEILSVPILISVILLLAICLSGSDSGELATMFQPELRGIFSQVINTVSCFFCIEITAIFICRAENRTKAKTALITGYSISSAVMLILTLCIVGTFTLNAGSDLLYPVTELARSVQLNYLRVVERFDAFMLAGSITNTCIFVALSCYCAEASAATIFGNKKFRYSIVIYPLLLAAVLLSINLSLADIISGILIYHETAMLFFVIPGLFIISLVKRKGQKT